MKTVTKVFIIIAVSCIALGVLMAAASWAFYGFGSPGVARGPGRYEKKTYMPDGKFENISVNIVETDVVFEPSSDGQCRVECMESDKVEFSVDVSGNTLSIVRHDNRKWYEFISFSWGLFTEDSAVKVYLPDKEYKKLEIHSVSGDISVPSFISLEDAFVKSVSGDIRFEAKSNGRFEASSTSGEISAFNISGSSAEIQTTSGDIDIASSSAEELSVKSVSGEIDISDTVAKNTLTVKTTSGDVELDCCDAAEINIKTVSGDVDGVLLSDKVFDVDTTSGDIRIPQRGENASDKCIVDTTSGDVKFKIK